MSFFTFHLLSAVNNNRETKSVGWTNGHADMDNHVDGLEDDDCWQQVGPKNHSVETNVVCIMHLSYGNV